MVEKRLRCKEQGLMKECIDAEEQTFTCACDINKGVAVTDPNRLPQGVQVYPKATERYGVLVSSIAQKVSSTYTPHTASIGLRRGCNTGSCKD